VCVCVCVRVRVRVRACAVENAREVPAGGGGRGRRATGQKRVHDDVGAVGLDGGGGRLGADDVGQVGPGPQRADGHEVGRPRVLGAPAKHAQLAARPFVQMLRQRRDERSNLLDQRCTTRTAHLLGVR
jgi:hypothetical protein